MCYAEQHDLDMSKSHVVLPSDAPVPVSGPIPAAAAAAAAAAPWPNHYQQQQQQYSPPPPSSAIPNYPTDQHSSTVNAAHSTYPASVAPSTGWHSASPPPPSAMYAPTQGAFGPLPPLPEEKAVRGGGDKDGLRILGLRPATFFLSIALVIVIVIAAVGGGVGGSMAVENAKRAAAASALSESGAASTAVSTVTTTVSVRVSGGSTPASETTPTPTPTPSRSAKVAVPPTQGVIDFDCGKVDPTLDINLGNRRSSFETMCGQDLIGSGIDILGIIVYNHAHCAQACASYNRNLGRNECVAVSFQADLSVLSNFGNCFLKNSTGSAQKKSNTQVSYKLKLDG